MKRALVSVAVLAVAFAAIALLSGAASTYPTSDQVTRRNMDLYLAQTLAGDAAVYFDAGTYNDASIGIWEYYYNYGDAGGGWLLPAAIADSNACALPSYPCATIAGLLAKIPARIEHTVSLHGDITPYDVTSIRAQLASRSFGPNGAVTINQVATANLSPSFNVITANSVLTPALAPALADGGVTIGGPVAITNDLGVGGTVTAYGFTAVTSPGISKTVGPTCTPTFLNGLMISCTCPGTWDAGTNCH